MQKDDLLKEQRELINIRTSVNNIINSLSNSNNKETLSKISYTLSSYYTVDGINPKTTEVDKISGSIDTYVSSYKNILVYINNRLRELEKEISAAE